MIQGKYVSIVLPTYNRASKLGKAIQSVLSQTYPYFELLVIDDGSQDETQQVTEAFKDERICYHRLQQNEGQSRARNYGIKLAQYEYIAFEDSDDLWHPRKLEIQMRTMQELGPEVGFSYHKLRYNLGEGKSMILPDQKIAIEKKSGDIYEQLLWDNMVGMPTLLIRQQCIRQIGILDETMQCLEDYDFALRLARAYPAAFVNEILLDAEFSNTGVSGNSYQYLIASCQLIQKYKSDYLASGTFNHRLEIILRDAGQLGIKDKIVQFLEKIMQC